MTLRTRFAPSPTGMLHIGNARAALFNFLLARHFGGEFYLRIEDTDKERSTQEAIDVIFSGLRWMDISFDGHPVMQSQREKRHREVALELLEKGLAYKCFCTPEELKEMREEARKSGKPPRYNGKWRDKDPSLAPKDAPFVVRIKAPREGKTTVHDLVQGEVTVANSELDDMVILRSDGSPTYQHAVVVDDHDMNITHVMRGDDHLTNTFRQIMIYNAMGWEVPKFAHLPLIHGPDGAKLSKRHGAQSVLEFKEMGYLPEALCNYLLRLGWGHGDDEILSREEQIKLFDFSGIGRSPSRMDYKRLEHMNAVWLRRASNDRLCRLVIEKLSDDESVVIDASFKDRLAYLMEGLKSRARTINELAENAAFLGRRLPLPQTPKAQKIIVKSYDILKEVTQNLSVLGDFSTENINKTLRDFAQSKDIGLGKIAQPLRAAVTGSTISPGIDETLCALGKEETLARIGDILDGEHNHA